MGDALVPYDRRDAAHRPFAPPRTPAPMRMAWRDAVILSWRVEPAAMRAVLPPSLEPDLFDATAWISVVAFKMDRKRLFGGLRVWRGMFPELNVRTYVRRAGVPGIRFLSMDTTSRLVTMIGRAMAMPYRYARVLETGHGLVQDEPKGLGRLAFRVVPGPGRAPSALDAFLAERYVAFAGAGGRVLHVHHGPWALRDVAIQGYEAGFMASWVGDRRPDHVVCSDGVDAGAWYALRAPRASNAS